MGDFVEELLVRLGIDIDRQSINRAVRSLDDVEHGADDAGEAAHNMGASFANMASVIATASAAISGAVGAMVVSYAEAGTEIGNLSKLANTSSEVLQRNAAAAKTVGVQTEELAQIYKDMGDRVGDFLQTGGGPMADFFENIAPKVGVTAEQFRDLSGPDALQLFTSSLDAANLSQSEMTFFLESMAGDLTKLQPLLANGGAEMKRLGEEAERTGAIMDSASIETAAELSKEMGLASLTMQGLRNTIAKELAPTVLEIIKSFREFIAENRELISLGLARLFDAARFALRGLTVAVAVFLSYKLGLAVLAIAKGVRALTAAFTIARTAAMLFNAAALLIPVLIGAAVVATGLLFEDLFTFLNGGDSLIGRLIEKFPLLGEAIDAVKNIANDVIGVFSGLQSIIMGLLTLDPSRFFSGFGKIFEAITSRIRAFTESIRGVAGWLGFDMSDISAAGASGGVVNGDVPTSAGISTNNNSSVIQNDNRTFNVNGADTGMVKKIMREGHAYTARTVASGVEY